MKKGLVKLLIIIQDLTPLNHQESPYGWTAVAGRSGVGRCFIQFLGYLMDEEKLKSITGFKWVKIQIV